MSSWRKNRSFTICMATVSLFLLDGCATGTGTGTGTGTAGNSPSTTAAKRCPAGFSMVCEAKKSGRIRFGTLGKNNLESCGCEPEYDASRPQRRVIPQ